MPPRQLIVPLRGQQFPGSALKYIWADLPLFVKTIGNRFAIDTFRADTGAHMTEVSVDWAKKNHVPINGSVVTWPITTGSGTLTFRGQLGTIRVRVPTWIGVEFEWPCLFRHNRPPTLPPQLGMTGVIADVRICVEGTVSAAAPHGILRVEQL